MEPWFVESQAHTAELTAKWADAPTVPGTGAFTVRGGIGISSPEVPWLEPVTGRTTDGDYYLSAGGGGIEMPKGSGKYYLTLPMTATFPNSVSAEKVECFGVAFPGQVAECGGWVIRVTDAYEGGGHFVLLAYPDVPGYRLMQGKDEPVPGY